MKKTIFILLCLFIIPISAALATPPTSITLTYNLDKGNLHVEATHPSANLEQSYVRLMIVYVNGEQVASLNYYKQNDYEKFYDDVPVTVQVGDVIKVDLFCQLGGEMAQEITVTKPGAPKPDQNADGTDNTTSDNTTDNATENTAT